PTEGITAANPDRGARHRGGRARRARRRAADRRRRAGTLRRGHAGRPTRSTPTALACLRHRAVGTLVCPVIGPEVRAESGRVREGFAAAVGRAPLAASRPLPGVAGALGPPLLPVPRGVALARLEDGPRLADARVPTGAVGLRGAEGTPAGRQLLLL